MKISSAASVTEVEVDRPDRSWLNTFALLSSTLIVLALLVAILLAFRTHPQVETSMIRVANDTGVALQKVRVNGVLFGDVSASGLSQYQALTPAYRYASLRLEVAGQKFESIPDDYVGETPLGKGNFTYRIRRSDAGGVPYFDIAVQDKSPD
jgi:hypothetical protein